MSGFPRGEKAVIITAMSNLVNKVWRMATVGALLFALSALPAASAPSSLLYGFFPAQGSPRLLVILVETPDHPATLSPETIKDVIFSRNDDNVTSMAEYYDEVSYGSLHLQGEITGWLKLDKPMSQYAANSYGANASSFPNNYGGFVMDAVNAALASGVDLAPYDNDGDGFVDGLMIIHAGPDGAVTRDKSMLWSRVDYVSMYGGEPVPAGSVRVDRFSVCAEYIRPGQADAMRVYAHEFGHLMGLPDLYDPDQSSFGIGATGLMSILLTPEGMAMPPTPCAFSRMILGWTRPQIISGDTMVRLGPAATTPDAVRINTPFPDEYFLMEYREPVGMDQSLDGDGLLLFHAYDRAPYGNLFSCAGICDLRPLLALVQADGRNDLEKKKNKKDPADYFPGPEQVTSAGADTGNPKDPFKGANTLSFAGLPTGVRISDIQVGDGFAQARIAVDDKAMPVKDFPWLVITGQEWKEDKGNGNGLAEPGELMSLILRFTNLGVAARSISLQAGDASVKWRHDKARIMSIGPGQSEEATFSLAVPKTKTASRIMSAFVDTGKTLPDAGTAGGDSVAPVLLHDMFAASWFEPSIKYSTRKPATERSVKARLVMGVPPVLIVNDAPHDLIPYFGLALDALKIPYLGIDASISKLPDQAMISAPPLVLWLSGTRPLGNDFPDAARRGLMRAVVEAGHTLMFSASLLSGDPPAGIMDLFGVSEMGQGAGIGYVAETSGHPEMANLLVRKPYPYYPNLDPRLLLTPALDSVMLLKDHNGRSAAVVKGPEARSGAAIFLGFPLEALKPGSIAQVISAALKMQMAGN